MEFLNKFKHGDDKAEDVKPTYADSSVQTGETQTPSHDVPKHDAEEPSRDFLGKLIGGSGHHHHHEPGRADKDCRSFLEKLGRKEDREKKQLELEKRELELKYELEQVEKEKKDNEGFFDRLKDKFDGDIDKEKTQKEHKEDDKPNFFVRFFPGHFLYFGHDCVRAMSHGAMPREICPATSKTTMPSTIDLETN